MSGDGFGAQSIEPNTVLPIIRHIEQPTLPSDPVAQGINKLDTDVKPYVLPHARMVEFVKSQEYAVVKSVGQDLDVPFMSVIPNVQLKGEHVSVHFSATAQKDRQVLTV
jgi:hypothetical protein